LTGFAHLQPLITSAESVPFRLTPNIQVMMGRAGVEGVMTAAVTAISQSLLAPGFDLAGTLSLFVRDEVSLHLHVVVTGADYAAIHVASHVYEGT
jgi:transformation/transcription domain-associated protein